MQKCYICDEEVYNLQEHILICENKYISKEFEDLIPCEICNNLINFDDYHEHINTCGNPLQGLNFNDNNENLVNFLMNITNQLNQQYNTEVNINQADNEVVQADNEVVQVDNEVVQADNEVVQADNEVVQVDNEVVQADNEVVQADNEMVQADNEVVQADNEVDIYNYLNNYLNNELLFTFTPNANSENNLNNPINILNNFQNINLDNQENNYEDLTNLSETIGNVNIGIKNKELFIEKKNDKIINCPICVTEHNNYILTKCNHEFCEECINEWLNSNNTCPLCNYEFIEK
jgi:hypothetical protein